MCWEAGKLLLGLETLMGCTLLSLWSDVRQAPKLCLYCVLATALFHLFS